MQPALRIAAAIMGCAALGAAGATPVWASPSHISAGREASADPEDAPPTDPTIAVENIPLSAPLSLRSADALAAASPLDVIGYYYDNGPVVGEFYSDGPTSESQFLNEFGSLYGTEPLVTQFVVSVDNSDASALTSKAATARAKKPSVIVTNKPAFKPKAVNEKKLAAQFKTLTPSRPQVAGLTAAAANDYGSWAPDTVSVNVVRAGGHQNIDNFITWRTTDNNNTPADFGMEVDVDFLNGASGIRNYGGNPSVQCPSGFREKFIGINRDWNWSATSSEGKVGAGKAYADYNDLYDSCGRNAMTIGFQFPRLIPGKSLITRIDAPVGKTSTSELAGSISLVHDDCSGTPTTLTDCMGLYDQAPPASAHSPRFTLGASRHWAASPSLCWKSSDFGTSSAPVKQGCPS